jgi:hypothetical protein
VRLLRPIALGTLLLAAGCMSSQQEPAREVTLLPVPVSGCATEAEKLRSPLPVHSAPDSNSAIVATLQVGQFLYRCDRSGDWLGIKFPRDRPVDCSTRQCPSGWIDRAPDTEIYG